MTDFYVDNANGSDANSGSSEDHTAPLSGTAATRSTNVYTLDGSPDLSGIVDNADTIAIVGETSGQGSEGTTVFLITAHDDGADTVTVSPTPTGGTSGLTWAIGGAFATLEMVHDNAVLAGDTAYIQSGTVYDENVSTSVAGAVNNPIAFIGYTTVNTDEGKFTLTPTSGQGITHLLNGIGYLIYKNMTIDGATTGFDGNNMDTCHFYNCDFLNNSGIGVTGDNNYIFVNCTARGSGNKGFDIDQDGVYVGCISGSNGHNNFFGLASYYYKNVAYNPPVSADNFSDTSTEIFIGNIADGDNKVGSQNLTVGTQVRIVADNIIYDAGQWGVEWSGAVVYPGGGFIGYNLVDSNTSGDYESPNGWEGVVGYKDVAMTPLFIDEAGDDYRAATGSPAINTGVKPGGIT